jgi:hypothetical protein
MKLIDIKQRLLTTYFSSANGDGLLEAQAIIDFTDDLLSIVEIQRHDMADDLREYDDSTLAYRALTREDVALGYIVEDEQALYMVSRNGKRFAAVNLTSPTKAVRTCTLREVRDAFLQAHNHNPNVTFKVKATRHYD